MDGEKLPDVDELLQRVRGAALESLATVVDIDERLQAVHRARAADEHVAGAVTEPR